MGTLLLAKRFRFPRGRQIFGRAYTGGVGQILSAFCQDRRGSFLSINRYFSREGQFAAVWVESVLSSGHERRHGRILLCAMSRHSAAKTWWGEARWIGP